MPILNKNKKYFVYKNNVPLTVKIGTRYISNTSYKTYNLTENTLFKNTGGKIKELTVYGKSRFENGSVSSLTSPVITVGGKNFFDLSAFGDISSWELIGRYNHFPLYLPAGTYTLSCDFINRLPNIYLLIRGARDYAIAANGSFVEKRTFRVSEGEVMYIAWYQSGMNQAALDAILNNFITNIQLEVGSDKTALRYYKTPGIYSKQGLVLRSIPVTSGEDITDTFDFITGRVTRNVSPDIDLSTVDITDKLEYALPQSEISYLTPLRLSAFCLETSILYSGKYKAVIKAGV